MKFILISYLVLGIIKVLLNKSLKTLWETLDSIQQIYFLKYINVLMPYMLSNVLDLFNLTAKADINIFDAYYEEDNRTPDGFFNAGSRSV